MRQKTSTALIRKSGLIEDTKVTILFDSGASVNVIRPGLAQRIVSEEPVQIELFDGSRTKTKTTRKVQADVRIGKCQFWDMVFIEWELPSMQDVIFGRPWHYDYRPIYDWQTEQIRFPEYVLSKLMVSDSTSSQADVLCHQVVSAEDFKGRLKSGCYEEIFRVKVKRVPDQDIPSFGQPVIDKFRHVFPDQLSDGLPPSRNVELDVELKPDAVPSTRPAFRLSKL